MRRSRKPAQAPPPVETAGGQADDELLGLRSSTGYLLSRLGAESRRRWGRLLSGHGLTSHQYGVLRGLAELGPTYQQRIAAIIGIDPRNASPVVEGLHERELVERVVDPADRRRRAIRLTTAGRALVTGLDQATRDTEHEMLGGLSEADRDRLHELLLRVLVTSPGR